MKTAELKVLPVSVLRPAEYNPRKKLKPGDKEYKKIKASIEEFGFADPLVVNADMTIIGGHQRLTVAMDLGYTEVPCAVVDVDKTREKALNIALNKITGQWDEEMLAALLKDLDTVQFNTDLTGFEKDEIAALCSKLYDKDVKEDGFDVDKELRQPVFSRLGDLWLLGNHRVICGDSTDEEVYTRLKFVAIIPDFELKTEKARACLPKEISHRDAVYNLSRAALFSASLLIGKFENLKTAVDDRLHQPYRMELIPNVREVFDIAYTHGAYAVYISGAGPTVMAIADESNTYFAGKLQFSLENAGLGSWKVHELTIDNDGTKIL